MTMLSLTLLGSFTATLDERPLDQFRTNKVQALLIYLVAETSAGVPGVHRREAIMELLWPGLPQPSAQVNLRQIIYQLHKLVPDGVVGNGDTASLLLAERQTVQLNPAYPVVSDVAAFTGLLRRSHVHSHTDLMACAECQTWLEEAAALYRGDFLTDFILYDSNTYEAWSQVKRESLHRQMLDVLDTLTIIYTEQADYWQAEASARRQLEMDNYRESAYRQLMRVLALSGRRSEALAVYENGRRLLSEELGMAPAVKTTALYEQIRAGDLSLATPAPKGIRGYELQEKIGEGAFGAVHRAYQKGVGREVAVKIIHPQYANQPNFIRRFESEAQLVARLEHPYIVPLYDYWREPDSAYLVMRWLRGGSLQDALAKRPYPPAATLTLIEQIAAALHIAHRQGIIHRDVKPSNILLDEEGNAYLSDFGIAKDTSSAVALTLPHEMVGSPAYISPEQLLGEVVTPATDIYSLGLVLFEMLTGARPFTTTSMAELIQKQVNEPLPLVCSQRPDLPTAVDDVIQRATAKKANDRFPDAPALATAFREAIQRNGVKRPTTLAEAIDIIPESEIVNPYKGLRPFLETDAAHFYGRSALVQQLLSRLDSSSNLPPFSLRGEGPSPVMGEGRGGGRFLTVVGPSGSGKSSVVKAGLIPALRAGALPGSENWFVAEMMPGSHPLEELEAALMRVAVNPPPSLLEPLQKDERGLARVLKRILPQEAVNGKRLSVIGKENRLLVTDYGLPTTERSQLLLVIDQFEELFTLVPAEADRVHFINLLLAALAEPYSRLWLVLTLRADFYDRPLQYTELGELLRWRTEVVLPLTPVELEQAITRPAASVGVACEPALVTAITAEVNEQPGALPLVQYALTEAFERRDGRTLTLAAYQASGGVTGALARRADEIYDSLTEDGRAATRQLFLRLITLGEGVEDTRRRVKVSELEALHNSSFIIHNFNLFGRYRLLTFDRDPISREPTVEVAHEALLREWGRLREWLDESRADVRLQRLLAGASAEWHTAAQDSGFLLRGSRLDQFEGWAEQTDVGLTQDEREFLAASVAARRQRRTEEETRRQRELETARQLAETERQRAEEQTLTARRLRRRALYLAGVMFVAVLLAAAAIVFQQLAARNEATAVAHASLAATREAEARLSEAEALSNAQLAATREVEALNSADLAATSEALALSNANLAATRQAEAETEANLRATAEAIAQTNLTGATALLLAAEANNLLLSNGSPDLIALLSVRSTNMLYSPSGDAALEGVALLGAPPREFIGPRYTGQTVSFSPDGKTLATGGNLLILWDFATGQQLRDFAYEGPVQDLLFSADGRYIFTTSDDSTARQWDVASGEQVRLFAGHTANVPGIALSPDGKYLLTASEDGTARLWDIATGETVRIFTSINGFLGTAAISPDGKYVLAGGGGNPQLWDLASGELLRTFVGHTSYINGVAFSPDSQQIASASDDHTARIWDVATGQQLILYSGHKLSVRDVFFSPDGKQILSGSNDGTVQLWDVATGQTVRVFSQAAGAVTVAFSPDGKYVASSGNDGIARVWSLQILPGEMQFIGHENSVSYASFSPDGKVILTASQDGTARLWEAATGQELLKFVGHTNNVLSAFFSPDGKRVLTTSWDTTARLWDVVTGEELLRFVGHTDAVRQAAFSPDGRYIVTSSDDGTARVWDAQTAETITIYTSQGPLQVLRVAFSPDGKTVVTSGGDGTARIWEPLTGKEIMVFTGHTEGVNGVAFSPDGKQVVTASADSTVRLWDVASGDEVRRFAGHPGGAYGADFSPDGKYIVTSGADGTARLWEVATGVEVRRFTGHKGPIRTVVFSPDGKYILTASTDNTARLWLTDYHDTIRHICSLLTRDFTPEERAQYGILDDEPTCPGS